MGLPSPQCAWRARCQTYDVASLLGSFPVDDPCVPRHAVSIPEPCFPFLIQLHTCGGFCIHPLAIFSTAFGATWTVTFVEPYVGAAWCGDELSRGCQRWFPVKHHTVTLTNDDFSSGNCATPNEFIFDAEFCETNGSVSACIIVGEVGL